METNVLPTVYVPADQEAEPDNAVTLGSPRAEDPDTGVTLSGPGSIPVTLPDASADNRAARIKMGIGDYIQKDTQTIRQEIQMGRENYMRQEAASKLTQENTLRKQKKLIELANQKGGPLNEDEVARIMDPYNPANRPVDPDSVVERQYGTAYIKTIQEAINAVPNNPVAEAQQEISEQVNESFLTGSLLTAKMAFATKLREDQEAIIGKQSYIGRGADAVKQMFQPYNELKMRGLTPGVGYTEGGDLGSNLQATADKVFGLPFDEYTKEATRITKALAVDNPQLAHKFAEYLEGVSKSDRFLDGVFTYMLPMDAAAVGGMGLKAARAVSLTKRTNTAVKQFIKEAADTPVGRAEASGNIDKAAELRATDNILQDMNGTGNPVKIATDDSLLTSLNQDKAKLITNKGSLSTDQVVRIQDAYDSAGKTLLQRIVDAARINRTPMALATQNAVRIVKETIKDYYPGIRNAILDVSNPLYEPRSNTYWFETTFGNIGGKLFSNENTAKNFAELHGMKDVKIIEGFGSITNAETEKMLERKAFVENQITDWEQTVARRRGEAGDKKFTPQQRAEAKSQADGIQDFINKGKQEASDLDLKLKGKNTFDHAQRLEAEINQFKVTNKDLRKALRAEKDAERAAHILESIEFGQEQIKAKAKEFNAIKEGKASVVGSGTTVEQHGVGYKIVTRRPLVETDYAVRDLLIRDSSGKLIPEAISTSSQTGFKSLMNAAIGKFRGADDTLALNESINRKIGTYTQSLFKEWAQQEAAYIKQIASGVIRTDPVTGETIPYWKAKPIALWNKVTLQQRRTYNEFVRTLDHARDAKDPDTGKPGYFFETPGQLENHYWKNYRRAPSFAEHEAYFAFVRMVEGDRIWREISEFRNRARVGTEQHSISARGPDGKPVKSDFFDGISMKEFPGGDDVMMIMSKKLGEEKLVNLGGAGIGPTKLAEYREAVKQGRLRVIRIYAPEHKPLREFSDVAGNEHVRYVLTDAIESKPIEFNHVNRRGGGHFEYDYDNFLKQASMYHQYESGVKGRYRSVYTGDTTFMPVLNRVMGRDIADKMHVIQKLIREGDLEGAKRFTQAHLPIEWDELHGMFKPGRDANGKVTPAKLDLNEPFHVVPKGKSVYDMDSSLEKRYGTAFKDGTRSGSDNKKFQVAYNTERESYGLNHLEDIGTDGNPLYKYSPKGLMVDPITTMNRSLNRIVNSAFMDDYKMFAVEHWLREAEAHLEPVRLASARSSPFWVFQSANDKTAFRAGVSPDVVRNLLSNRYKINQFVGIPNATDTAIHTAVQWLTDVAYQSFGSTGLGAKAMLAPIWMLEHVKDPFIKMRSMAFHAKLGIFNPAQLLVQAQTFSTILSVSPLHGTAGTYATLLHQWSRLARDADFVNTLDRYATKLNVFGQSKWRPGEFKEAMAALDKVGFDKVAGEYANLNTALKTDFVGNDFKNILNAGTVFFREGEKSTRLGAWYTAFREFREANPVGALTKNDLGKILQRADLLTVNMSRASNSALNHGVLSLPMQFLTYQIRLAELFWGSRITPMAKLRLLTFYSAMYGASSAVGISGAPMTNAIREEAIQRGYTPGENWLSSAVDLGLPTMLGALITGGGDWKKGTLVNFGSRMGSPGMTQFNDALKSDTPWWKLIGGASGTTLLNTLTAGHNFFRVMGSMLNPRDEDKAFPPKLDDLVDFTKEVSSINQLWGFITAINTGKRMSKSESYIGDVSKAGAAFYALTGMGPQAQEDTFLKADIRKAEVDLQKWAMKEFIKEYRRGLQSARDNNPQQAADFTKRAFTILEGSGFPTDKKATAIAIATKGYETQIRSEDWAFAFKNVPKSRSTFLGIPTPFTTQSNVDKTRREQFTTQQKLDKYKGQ